MPKDDLDNEEYIGPKTVQEALDLYLTYDFDVDMIHSSDKQWVIKYLEGEVMDLCHLRENEALCAACGSTNMSAEDAAKVIAEAIWTYFNIP